MTCKPYRRFPGNWGKILKFQKLKKYENYYFFKIAKSRNIEILKHIPMETKTKQ